MSDEKKAVTLIAPLLISFLALLVAIRSCAISHSGKTISEAEYRAERTLILTAVVSKDNKSITLEPVNKDITLLTLSVVSPEATVESGWKFTTPLIFETDPPGRWVTSSFLRDMLNDLHLKEAEGTPGSMVSMGTRVPIIVSCSYIARGERRNDTAIYALKYTYYREADQEGTTEISSIRFANLEFVQNIAQSEAMSLRQQLFDGIPFILQTRGEQPGRGDAENRAPHP